ncbi:MAG TPA: glycoside hydrolase family 2 TIM barrel-domain containing protein [Verrucomicrobiae bacterium]|jgi:beta-glucuronidase|nr:glycoside hydrolase family 2 TIM barrel-domain containing protein [Verrucomicrobiae bacterium]
MMIESRCYLLKSVFCVVILALFLTHPCLAQVAPLIANIDARQNTNLDGAWHVIVDPFDVGQLDYRARPLKNNNAFFKDYKPQSKSELVEYDFDHSGQLNVPGDWNTQRESLLFYEGTVWYKQTFDYPKAGQARVFVHFGAANYHADVYLNGEALGHHEGGFTPFDFEITGRVRPQGNFLVVRVNDTRERDQVPALTSDWWNYGGITRPVTLVEVPQTFIQDYAVQLDKGSMRSVKGWVQLNGPKLQQRVTIQIPEAGLSKVFQTDANGRADVSFDADLDLWSPDKPRLYKVEIAGETDRVADSIGFRSIETKGTDILLNGAPIFLRGINLHEEAPLRPGRAWSDDDARTLLGWAKELGCNFVRLAHYPHNEAMLRMADQMGVLVWAEVPVYWNIQWENLQTLRNAENQLKEMIARDHNRAALIIYSVANETPVSDARNRFLRQLIQDAHSLDRTRLVSAALQDHEDRQGDRIRISIQDPIANDLDVLGNNEYIGWYTHSPADADFIDWTSKYDKPLIMSEFGGDARFGYHGDTLTRWTEEYQENLYQRQIAMLKRIPFLRGTTPWILKDFRSPRRTLPGIEDYFNRKGLVTEHGEKKKAFFVLQKFYREVESAQAR